MFHVTALFEMRQLVGLVSRIDNRQVLVYKANRKVLHLSQLEFALQFTA